MAAQTFDPAEASNRSISILRDLIAIPTYQDSEAAIDYLVGRLEEQRIRYHVSLREGRKYNLIAEVGPERPGDGGSQGPGKVLILNSHIDTVPPGSHGWTRDPFKAEIQDDRIYGLGACDATASLAAMVAALEVLAESGVPLAGTVVLAAVSGEETGGLGTQLALAEGLTGTAAIVGEPTSLIPKVAHKGVLRCYVDVQGKAAHASAPRLGINAISKMAKVIIALDGLAEAVETHKDDVAGHASLAVTTVGGGRALNIIPDSCRISIDRRLVPGETEEGALSEIESVIAQCKVNDPDLSATVSKLRFLPPSKTDPSHELVSALRRATRTAIGADPGVGGFEASCDMTFLVNRAGIPTVIFGPGDLSLAHHADEFVEIRQVRLAAEIYARAVMEYL
ncbi:MAG TPA: M20 family metallopeptidase [Firmicutes bacterium]|nr:M20 family metallopeptidase [Bacillota bacterium]